MDQQKAGFMARIVGAIIFISAGVVLSVLWRYSRAHVAVRISTSVSSTGGSSSSPLNKCPDTTVPADKTRWLNTTAFPLGFFSKVPVSSGEFVYLVGGQEGLEDSSSSFVSHVNSDGTLGPWRAATPLARELGNAVIQNGYVYALAGDSAVFSASLNVDGSIDFWRNMADAPAKYEQATLLAGNNYIYLVGGSVDEQGAQQSTSSIFAALALPSGSLGSWRLVGRLPNGVSFQPSQFHALGSGYIYVPGEYPDTATATTSAILYAPVNSSDGMIGDWQTSALPSGDTPDAPGVITDGSLYLLSGHALIGSRIGNDGSLRTWVTQELPPQYLPASSLGTETIFGIGSNIYTVFFDYLNGLGQVPGPYLSSNYTSTIIYGNAPCT